MHKIVEPFLYREIISEKSNNIILEINKPFFEKTVLVSDQKYEGDGNGYYSIMLVNGEYRMYYRGIAHDCWKDKSRTSYYSTEELTPYECFCLESSNDGLNFEKSKYGVLHLCTI